MYIQQKPQRDASASSSGQQQQQQLEPASVSLENSKHRKLLVSELRAREAKARRQFKPSVVIDVLCRSDPESVGKDHLNSVGVRTRRTQPTFFLSFFLFRGEGA